jgi:hypothetical protein
MPRITIIAIDLVATGILVFGLYFPRHRRRDMVVAYLGLNVGVLTVALALSANTSIGTGFGLGLFGALSIIRLRSSELGHEEVAYYFAALALGLLGGIEVDPPWVAVALRRPSSRSCSLATTVASSATTGCRWSPSTEPSPTSDS